MSSYLTSLSPSSVKNDCHVYRYHCVLQRSSIGASRSIEGGAVYSCSIDSREGVDKKVAFHVESHDSDSAYQSLPKFPDCTSPPDKDLRVQSAPAPPSEAAVLTPLASNCSWHATQQHDNPIDDRHLMEHVQAIPQATANGWDTMGPIELGSIATRFSHEEEQIQSDRSLLT